MGNAWNYICVLLDLFNREIIGYSAGSNKSAELVHAACAKDTIPLNKMQLLYTDQVNEFKNATIESLLNAFNIQCSLSHKGCPNDNAVAEATFKIIKTEFVYGLKFNTLENLQLDFSDYVNWFDTQCVHIF